MILRRFFFWDSNLLNGVTIDSAEQMATLLETVPNCLEGRRSRSSGDSEFPSFGFRSEHTGQTLKEYLEAP